MVYNDILLDTNGDIRLDEYNDGILTNSVVQDINVHLKWFLGEWPLDESKGVDWFNEAFVKNPDADRIGRMVRREIESRDGVTSVESVEVVIDSKNRTAVISWKAKVEEDILESEVKLWGSTV